MQRNTVKPILSAFCVFFFIVFTALWLIIVVWPLYGQVEEVKERMTIPTDEQLTYEQLIPTISWIFLAVPLHSHVSYYSAINGTQQKTVNGPIEISYSEVHDGWYESDNGWIRISDFTFEPEIVARYSHLYKSNPYCPYETFSFIDINNDNTLEGIHRHYGHRMTWDDGCWTIVYECRNRKLRILLFDSSFNESLDVIHLSDGTIGFTTDPSQSRCYRWFADSYRFWWKDASCDMPTKKTQWEQFAALVCNKANLTILLIACLPAGLLFCLGLLVMGGPAWSKWTMLPLLAGVMLLLALAIPDGIHNTRQYPLLAWRIVVMAPVIMASGVLILITTITLFRRQHQKEMATQQ